MKKIILTLGLMASIGLSAMAQKRGGERPSPEQRATKMTEKMAEELSLTADQKKQVLEINLAQAKKMDQERQDQMKANEARKAEMKKQDEQIKAVLTEEQLGKWEEIKLEAKDRRGRPGGQIEDREEFRKRRGGGN
jgi:broad specificity polyphosphatase/5'/3'-nucleotidase SurE